MKTDSRLEHQYKWLGFKIKPKLIFDRKERAGNIILSRRNETNSFRPLWVCPFYVGIYIYNIKVGIF